MATARAIREGIAANLAPLGHQVSATTLANPWPPCAFVQGPSIEYDRTFGGGDDDWTFTVVVLVGDAVDQAAQEALDEYMARDGARSVKALIESDRRLGGACSDLRVTSASGPRLYASDTPNGPSAAPMLGCEWTVQVIS